MREIVSLNSLKYICLKQQKNKKKSIILVNDSVRPLGSDFIHLVL